MVRFFYRCNVQNLWIRCCNPTILTDTTSDIPLQHIYCNIINLHSEGWRTNQIVSDFKSLFSPLNIQPLRSLTPRAKFHFNTALWNLISKPLWVTFLSPRAVKSFTALTEKNCSIFHKKKRKKKRRITLITLVQRVWACLVAAVCSQNENEIFLKKVPHPSAC